MVEEKYVDILDKYHSACKDLQNIIDDFHEKWNPIMAGYDKEIRNLRRKYKRMAKEL